MLPGAIHIHKNRLAGSLNILLFLLPVAVFALIVSMAYSLLRTSSQYKSLAILGDAAFNEETWEYVGQ